MAEVEPVVRVPEGFEEEFPDGSALATEVFLNIGMLVGGVRSTVESLLRSRGITSMAAFNVLAIVGGDDHPLQPSIIAERMMVTRATMTGLLDALERRGLIRRTEGASDRRHRLVALTRSGRGAVDTLVPEMHRFERALMDCLDPREQRALLSSVAKLQHHLLSVAPGAELGIR